MAVTIVAAFSMRWRQVNSLVQRADYSGPQAELNSLRPWFWGAMFTPFQQKANYQQRHAYARDEPMVNAA